MGDSKKISHEDRMLFRETVSGVRRLDHDSTAPFRRRISSAPKQRIKDEQSVMQDLLSDPVDPADLETGDELLFVRSGISPSTMRKLRRGMYRIDAELDLHRLTSTQAREAITQFFHQCVKTGARCVRIIHGKGLSSQNKTPVLKGKVNYWLKQKDEVLAFCSARPSDGGTGAVYVLIKRMR